MRPLLLILCLFAVPAEAGLWRWCRSFLVSESTGRTAVWDRDEDRPDVEILRLLQKPNPPAAPPAPIRILGTDRHEVEAEFLGRVGAVDLFPFIGYDVPFAWSAWQIQHHPESEDTSDTVRVASAKPPQRVLRLDALPRGERYALQTLQQLPESQAPYRGGFREWMRLVAYLRTGGVIVSGAFLGEPTEVPMELLERQLENIRHAAEAVSTGLYALTMVHIHPERNVPLTDSDAQLVIDQAKKWRRLLSKTGFVAIVAGSAAPTEVAFRYAAPVKP